MARYIDADALREPLSVIIENAEAKELYNIAFNYEHCLKMIEDTPTADVAPRAEVAREIFEELEKYMMGYVDVTHTAYQTIGTSTFAILKRKYTEGEKC